MVLIKKYLRASFGWLSFAFLIYSALALVFIKGYRSCVLDGVSLWFFTVLPALFPYFFITNLLTSLSATKRVGKLLFPVTKRVFNTGGLSGYAFFISLISGYPVGAKTVCDLKNSNLLGEVESERASVFCSTSSPAFLIGVVGGVMANDIFFGSLLFFVHLFSAVITGFIFSFYKRSYIPTAPTKLIESHSENILGDSAYSSLISILTVGALITIFYLFSNILLDLRLLTPFEKLFSLVFNSNQLGSGLTFGLIESTNGLKQVFSNKITFFTLPVASFICSFGGLSAIVQSITFLKKAKIKTAPFLLGKVLTAFVSFIIAIIFSFIFYR